MKADDRVRSPYGEKATVLEVMDNGSIRLRFDGDAEYARQHGTSNHRAEQVRYSPTGFTVVP